MVDEVSFCANYRSYQKVVQAIRIQSRRRYDHRPEAKYPKCIMLCEARTRILCLETARRTALPSCGLSPRMSSLGGINRPK